MDKLKEVYSMWLDELTELEIEIANNKATILKATRYEGDEDIEQSVYCKPNISFKIIPVLDLEAQIRYGLEQRDRINKIENKIEAARLKIEMIRERIDNSNV
ncbi:MAG: hypothetical protein ACRC18_06850 [Cetobacterium sp.]